MASYRLAKSRPARAQLLARTDGRTNERPTHLLSISHVPNRTGENGMFTRSDMDFTEFILTRNAARVRKERFVEQVTVTLRRMYDNETEYMRVLMRQDDRRAA